MAQMGGWRDGWVALIGRIPFGQHLSLARASLTMYIGPGPIISTMFIKRASENLSRAQRGDLDVFIKPPSRLMSDWPSELIEKCAFG